MTEALEVNTDSGIEVYLDNACQLSIGTTSDKITLESSSSTNLICLCVPLNETDSEAETQPVEEEE